MKQKTNRFWTFTFFSILTWVLFAALAVRLGGTANASWEILSELRIPRVILATAVGAALAVSGAVLQALFTNPLCEPYTLGISSGCAVGAVIGSLLGLDFLVAGLAGSAFLGGFLFLAVLYVLSLSRAATTTTLLLAGVMLGFLGSSVVSLWMAIGDPNGIQGALYWLLGNLSRARMQGALFSLLAVAILLLWVWRRSESLDRLLLGEEGARSLGVPVERIRRELILITSLLVGVAVSGGGMIGFVGLVVPHLVRKYVGSLHRKVLPLCAIIGAAVLTLADLLSRVVLVPYELPVGVVTALFGAPLFIWILFQRMGGVRR